MSAPAQTFTPSWRDSKKRDEFVIKGRNMWPDLKDIGKLEFRRELVPETKRKSPARLTWG